MLHCIVHWELWGGAGKRSFAEGRTDGRKERYISPAAGFLNVGKLGGEHILFLLVRYICFVPKRMRTTGGGPVPAGELLLDRFSTNVKKNPSKKIFSFIVPGLDGGRIQKSYTYNELAEETSLLAQRLLEAGLKRGDR